MTIERATKLYAAALAEEAAAHASGDATRIKDALAALTGARKALDAARPSTSLDHAAFVLAAE